MPRRPNATRVARRACILASLTCRGNIDADAARTHDVYQRLGDWFGRLDLKDEVGPRERRLLESPLGTLTTAERVAAGWEVEGLAMMAWALKRFDLPAHDRKVDPFAVTDAVGLLANPAWLLKKPVARSRQEVLALREVLYGIHVRLTQFRRHRASSNIASHFEPRWFAAHGTNVLAPNGDLAIDGEPLPRAPEARWKECLAITAARHRASIWLAGEYPVYEDTPADT